jgi:hypothetical protein
VTTRQGTLAVVASARTSSVLPQPGGPNSSTPWLRDVDMESEASKSPRKACCARFWPLRDATALRRRSLTGNSPATSDHIACKFETSLFTVPVASGGVHRHCCSTAASVLVSCVNTDSTDVGRSGFDRRGNPDASNRRIRLRRGAGMSSELDTDVAGEDDGSGLDSRSRSTACSQTERARATCPGFPNKGSDPAESSTEYSSKTCRSAFQAAWARYRTSTT